MTNTTNDIELRPLSHVELIAHLTKRCETLTAERDTLKALCVERSDKLFSLARMITMHEFGAAMDFGERIIAERSGHDHPKT